MHKPFYYLFDEDEYKHFIKQVMKQFRGSEEYSIWRNSRDRDKCAATGMTNYDNGIQIEVHHYGKTLWDWVEYILNFFYLEDLPLNSFYICLILNELHSNDCISYVPLTHCIHKMLHTDYRATVAQYPDILSSIHPENMALSDKIIKNYVNLLKVILKEEDLLSNEAV